MFLFICYQFLPTEIKGKTHTNFQRSSSKPQYLLLTKYFKAHQYPLFQSPTKNHLCEGDTQTVGLKQRHLSQLWLSRAVHTNSCSSPALCLLSALPRNLQDDQVPALQGSTARGSKDRKTRKETNPYPHRRSMIKKNTR